jgi:hypothetical protein
MAGSPFGPLAARLAQQRGPVLRAPAGAGKSPYTNPDGSPYSGPGGFQPPRPPRYRPTGGVSPQGDYFQFLAGLFTDSRVRGPWDLGPRLG